MISEFSWESSLSLCFASFCTPRLNLLVTLGISWLPYFCIPVPYDGKDIFFFFFGVKKKKGGSSQNHSTSGVLALVDAKNPSRLGLLWYWMVGVGKEQRTFCHFWDCILDSFVDYKDYYSISSKAFLPISSRCNGHLNKIFPFWSILVHWFLKCRYSLLTLPVWPLPIYPDSWT